MEKQQKKPKKKVKNFDYIVIGKYKIKAWYFSPIPKEYHVSDTLYICDFCLSFFGLQMEYEYHMAHCKVYHPPGNEIYRSKEHNIDISVFEVDGYKEPIYCQNVAYLAKFFLDHKMLKEDMSIFQFCLCVCVCVYVCVFFCFVFYSLCDKKLNSFVCDSINHSNTKRKVNKKNEKQQFLHSNRSNRSRMPFYVIF